MLHLITLCLLGAFSLLYLTSVIPKSLGPVWKAIELFKQNLNYLGVISAVYSIATIFFTPFINERDSDMLVDIFAHLMLIIMALPYIVNFLEQKAKGIIPAAVISEFRSGFVGWISAREKRIGIVGAVLAFLLFLATAGMFNFDVVSLPTLPKP